MRDFLPFPKYDCDILDKDKAIKTYVTYMLIRTQSMFKYSGLPDSIPQDMLELYLQLNGVIAVTEVKGNLYALTGGLGGKPDAYYRPTIFTVANPYLDFSKSLEIDKDCVIIKNDSLYMGLYPLFLRYASQLTENDISIRTAQINSRIQSIIACSDSRTAEAAKTYLDGIVDGKIGTVAEDNFLTEIKVHNATTGATNNITQLIELQQFLKASWLNDLGVNANYNMKRESLTDSETHLNTNALYPLVDDMLNNRKKAVEKVNEMYGTNISVEFNSSWKLLKEDENSNQSEIEKSEVVENET